VALIQRSDFYVVLAAGSLIASAWMVSDGLKADARSTQMVAAAIDCHSDMWQRMVDNRVFSARCEAGVVARAVDQEELMEFFEAVK
jgi:hypothetical protein